MVHAFYTRMCLRFRRCCSKLWVFPVLLLFLLITSFSEHSWHLFIKPSNRDAYITNILQHMQEKVVRQGAPCRRPKLDLYNEEIRALFYPLEREICIGKSLVQFKGSNLRRLRLNADLLEGRNIQSCRYRSIIRVDDDHYLYEKPVDINVTEKPFVFRVKHDFFRVECSLLKSTESEFDGLRIRKLKSLSSYNESDAKTCANNNKNETVCGVKYSTNKAQVKNQLNEDNNKKSLKKEVTLSKRPTKSSVKQTPLRSSKPYFHQNKSETTKQPQQKTKSQSKGTVRKQVPSTSEYHKEKAIRNRTKHFRLVTANSSDYARETKLLHRQVTLDHDFKDRKKQNGYSKTTKKNFDVVNSTQSNKNTSETKVRSLIANMKFKAVTANYPNNASKTKLLHRQVTLDHDIKARKSEHGYPKTPKNYFDVVNSTQKDKKTSTTKVPSLVANMKFEAVTANSQNNASKTTLLHRQVTLDHDFKDRKKQRGYSKTRQKVFDVVNSTQKDKNTSTPKVREMQPELEDSDQKSAEGITERRHFQQLVVQVHPKQEILKEARKTKRDPNVVNVLVFIIESMSAMAFKRKMPKTVQVLLNIGGISMNGYNIVGDGTAPQLTAMLTGKTAEELPEVRRGNDVNDSDYVDSYPLLFYDFKKKGFVTMFAEDDPNLSTFNLRLNGFDEPPADHYMRPFWQAAKISNLNEEFCLGSKFKHKYTIDYATDFFRKYPKVPKFCFVFQSELTHNNINAAELLDQDLAKFLRKMKSEEHSKNTVMFLMGDHGLRYSHEYMRNIRLQSKLEERLPLAYIIPPVRWQKHHSELMQNIYENTEHLTSPFDVYETLKSLLNVTQMLDSLNKDVIPSRGISWFRRIPYDRTCADAGIETHWCTCLEQYNIDTDSELAQEAAKAIVRHVNAKTVKHRNKCIRLSLKKVRDVKLVIPNEKVLKYAKSADEDQRKPNFSRSIQNIDAVELQVFIQTDPVDGLYEATVKYYKHSRSFKVTAEVSRPDQYGNQPKCIEKDFPSLMKFCVCHAYLHKNNVKT